MSIDEMVAYDLEDLPIDVFEMADSGIEVESLTAGHGMVEGGASTSSSGGDLSFEGGASTSC